VCFCVDNLTLVCSPRPGSKIVGDGQVAGVITQKTTSVRANATQLGMPRWLILVGDKRVRRNLKLYV
jgi:hypothetical protein